MRVGAVGVPGSGKKKKQRVKGEVLVFEWAAVSSSKKLELSAGSRNGE